MFKETFLDFSGQHWPIIALLLFFAVMAGAIVWVYRRESGKVYKTLSQRPLMEDGGRNDLLFDNNERTKA